MIPSFLDIESTSLFADTGMLVCAVLRREDTDMVFFVDSPRREKPVLKRLSEEISRREALITFNGRSFDLPFLASRMLVLGLDDAVLEVECHVDVFEGCKHVLRFDKLSLNHIARVLGVEVLAGLDGRDVPRLYLSYLSHRQRELKDQIIQHCLSDALMLEKVYRRLEPLISRGG